WNVGRLVGPVIEVPLHAGKQRGLEVADAAGLGLPVHELGIAPRTAGAERTPVPLEVHRDDLPVRVPLLDRGVLGHEPHSHRPRASPQWGAPSMPGAFVAPGYARVQTRGWMSGTNRLIHETSPYLLQHARNPVDWFPWGPAAFERAVAENKPVLLSIGYSSCHWCHVMERESFENPAIGRLLNDLFVCSKVDRQA